MPLQILLNLLVAFVWMFLQESWDMMTFFVGYIIGMLFILALRRFFPQRSYVIRLLAVLNLLLLFIKELVASTISVTKQVVRPKLNITPGIFRTETPLTSDWEITTLCCLITLTPGSVVVEVAPEEGVLFIHTMSVPENEISVSEMKERFEKAILGVSK